MVETNPSHSLLPSVPFPNLRLDPPLIVETLGVETTHSKTVGEIRGHSSLDQRRPRRRLETPTLPFHWRSTSLVLKRLWMCIVY